MPRWIRTRYILLVTIFASFWLCWMGVNNLTRKAAIPGGEENDEELFVHTEPSFPIRNIFNGKINEFCKTHIESEKETFRPIALIKVYKAASSTLSNILCRYGLNRDMSFMLPEGDQVNQIFPHSPTDTQVELIPNCQNDSYQILNVHAVFRGRSDLHRLMPENTFVLSSVRDPIHQTKSAFKYNGFERRLKRYDLNFGKFMQDPYENTIKLLVNDNETAFIKGKDWGLWNSQSLVHGLKYFNIIPGLSRTQIENSPQEMEKVERFLEHVEREIDFTVVAEHFDESLVVLKHLLDLDWEDLVYFECNKAKKQAQGNAIERDLVEEWNYIDLLLYHKMKNKLFALKEQIGIKRIDRGVKILKMYIERCADACLTKRRMREQRGVYVNYFEFELSMHGGRNECCRQMSAQEWQYIPKLKNYMRKKCENMNYIRV